jgi:hypothetical protein
MFLMHFEKQIEKFYVAWSPSVLALCCLLLGEGTEAEQISVEAFHAYLSRGLDLDVGQLPSLLFVFALDAAKRAPLPSMPTGPRVAQSRGSCGFASMEGTVGFRASQRDGSGQPGDQRDRGDSGSRGSEDLDERIVPPARIAAQGFFSGRKK